MTKDFIIGVGKLPRGTRNAITDVAGVRVGHATVDHGDAHTGVTVIVPCEGNVYARKPVAAAHVLNGFGKTCGLVQLEELGCLETPIALTNTLCVGRVADALVTHALREAERDGLDLPGTINPVVGETNDGRINNIRARSVGGTCWMPSMPLAPISPTEQSEPAAARSALGSRAESEALLV